MYKTSYLLLLIFHFTFLFGEINFKKTGKIPQRTPFKIEASTNFLPYNPVAICVNPESSQIATTLIKLREKSRIFFFESNKQKAHILTSELENTENVNIFSKGYYNLDEWYHNSDLEKVDLLSINSSGNELEILHNAKDILRIARVVFVSSHYPPRSYEKLHKFLIQKGFTLVSHWETPSKEGKAFFVKTAYYKGAYERKLI